MSHFEGGLGEVRVERRGAQVGTDKSKPLALFHALDAVERFGASFRVDGTSERIEGVGGIRGNRSFVQLCNGPR